MGEIQLAVVALICGLLWGYIIGAMHSDSRWSKREKTWTSIVNDWQEIAYKWCNLYKGGTK